MMLEIVKTINRKTKISRAIQINQKEEITKLMKKLRLLMKNSTK